MARGHRQMLVDNGNGLRMHVLTAGQQGRPCLLLLHGFPELAHSWRRLMPGLAEAGYFVIAPDQRGYGQTTGWDPGYEGDLAPFAMPNLVADALGLVRAMGYRSVAAVIGHDFGSFVAGWCALLYPEVFRSLVLMSAPFAGAPGAASDAIHRDLAALPRPRKHYQWYYSTAEANSEMWRCPQGVHAFLRAYFHMKSADWKQNQPHALAGWTAAELEKMPEYYIMDLDKGMAATVEPAMPSAAEIAANRWLPEDDLRVYSEAFERTGFQGGLQWYRCLTSPAFAQELRRFSGKTIGVPSCFLAGASDWGIYQRPGALDRMRREVCTDMRLVELIEGAGHWVQQEQPEAVLRLLLRFLGQLPESR